MVTEYNVDRIKKPEDSRIGNLHFLLFLIHLSLVLTMIFLLTLGVGSSCCTLIFLILLLLNILFYWHRRKIHRIKREKLVKQSSSNLEISNLPIIYNFYCPKCLYQTNEEVEICPNCQKGVLSRTTGNVE